MDKDILKQYIDLKNEIKDLRRRMEDKEKKILQMEGCVVKDSVKGTRKDGTIGTITVEGFPYPELERRKLSLQRSRHRMQEKESEILEITEAVEKFIDEIPDSRTRRIFRHRYLDNMSWIQVAHCMGKKATPDGIRMIHDRFLKEL